MTKILWGALLCIVCGCTEATSSKGANALVGTIVSGNQQTGVVGTVLPQPLVVKVANQEGDNILNATVFFTVSGRGSITTTEGFTNSEGTISTVWTLGKYTKFNQTVDVRLLKSASDTVSIGTFTAVPLPTVNAFLIGYSSGNQTGVAGTMLPDSLLARIADDYENPIPNQPVIWTVTGGGGLLTALFDTSDANGYVSTRWTLGLGPGQNIVSLTVGTKFIRFKATATSASPGIDIEFIHPGDTTHVGNVISVSAIIHATHTIATVIAKVGNQQVPLTYAPGVDRWVGQLPIATIPPGLIRLIITATDVLSQTGSGSASLIHDLLM